MAPAFVPPPTFSRNAKNSAMTMVISGRASRITRWCLTAAQKTSSFSSVRKLSRPTNSGVPEMPRQLVIAM
jgi:hypothetical protein